MTLHSQYRWLAGGYDLELGYLWKCLAWWIVPFCAVKVDIPLSVATAAVP